MIHEERIFFVNKLYDILSHLQASELGQITWQGLGAVNGQVNWPNGGVYFFLESGEFRTDGTTPRIVRIGTHALPNLGGFGTGTLWSRLRLHKSGNTTSSIFRKYVGRALDTNDENEISTRIHPMPFVVLPIPNLDAVGAGNREIIENFCIMLVSNFHTPIDPSSPNWLGLQSGVYRVMQSGLWQYKGVSRDPENYPYEEALQNMDLILNFAGLG